MYRFSQAGRFWIVSVWGWVVTVAISTSPFYSTFYVTLALHISITVAFYSARGANEMPITFERAVFKSGDSYRVTIPMEIIKALGIQEKDVLTIWLDEPRIVMEKKATKK
jgi:hypothetical protein